MANKYLLLEESKYLFAYLFARQISTLDNPAKRQRYAKIKAKAKGRELRRQKNYNEILANQ